MRIRLPLLTILATAACLAPAASAEGPRAGYATNVNGDSVLPFDAFTGVAASPIPISGHLWGVAITPDGATAYVADESTDSVIPVDTATDVPGTSIPVGPSPRTLGITPDGEKLYVANIGGSSVTPIDLATNTAGAPIAVGVSPHGIAIAPDGGHVYVANFDSESISVIDVATDTVSATISARGRPYTLAITPDGTTLYVTNVGNNHVTRIDTASETSAPIPVGTETFGVALAPDGRTAYVSAPGGLIPIDTATNVPGTPIPIGSLPEGIGIVPDGSTAYVTDTGTDTVTPLDLSDGTTGPPMPTGNDPTTVAITPDRSPSAAFAASADGAHVTLDASASSDPDGTVARYAWDFGDGQTASGSQPTVSHTYAQPGSYTATLTVTDDEGCSRRLVFTGQTASCAGSAGAQVGHAVSVAAPATPTPPPAPAATARQAIERFTLDSRCVRLAADGKARIGLRLLLAKPGSVAVQVDRAVTTTNAVRCPKRDPHRHYDGRLRRVTTLQDLATQPVVAASVRRQLTRSFALRPGLYRIGVRAHDSGGRLTRAAYRWVRVLAR
jgi:YVTN family beta-propeller protein